MADEITPARTSGWTVTSQTEAVRPDGQGRFVPGVIVGFVTVNNVSGSVFVPDAVFNEATVRQMIAAKVAAFDAVGRISG